MSLKVTSCYQSEKLYSLSNEGLIMNCKHCSVNKQKTLFAKSFFK